MSTFVEVPREAFITKMVEAGFALQLRRIVPQEPTVERKRASSER
jgi:hypothetical protein